MAPRPVNTAVEHNSDVQFPQWQYIINDHYHMPHSCKDQLIQDHLALLRRTWFGAQTFLNSGVRLIREARSDEGRLAGIEYHLSQKPKFG